MSAGRDTHRYKKKTCWVLASVREATQYAAYGWLGLQLTKQICMYHMRRLRPDREAEDGACDRCKHFPAIGANTDRRVSMEGKGIEWVV